MKSKKTVIAILCILAVFFSVFPIAWTVLGSFKQPMDTISRVPKLLFTPTLANIKDLFTHGGSFSKYFYNSFVISVTSTLLSVSIAGFAGYSLARIRPRGHQAISMAILAMRMLPPIVIIVPLYLFCAWAGILDTLIALVIPYTALNIPLAVWMLRSFFIGLPAGLEEAAYVDGCSRFRAFLQIIMPLTAPGIAATSVFSFILAWNDFILALPLTSSRAIPLPIVASMARTEEGLQWGKIGAIICIMVIPVFIFTFASQRHMVSGLSAGAVKE